MIEQMLILVDKLMARGVSGPSSAMAAATALAGAIDGASERGRVISSDELLPEYPVELPEPKPSACGLARRLPFDPKEIVKYFPGEEVPEGLSEIMRNAQAGCGIGKAHFHSICHELLERKWVAQDEQSRWFRTSLSEEFVQ